MLLRDIENYTKEELYESLKQMVDGSNGLTDINNEHEKTRSAREYLKEMREQTELHGFDDEESDNDDEDNDNLLLFDLSEDKEPEPFEVNLARSLKDIENRFRHIHEFMSDLQTVEEYETECSCGETEESDDMLYTLDKMYGFLNGKEDLPDEGFTSDEWDVDVFEELAYEGLSQVGDLLAFVLDDLEDIEEEDESEDEAYGFDGSESKVNNESEDSEKLGNSEGDFEEVIDQLNKILESLMFEGSSLTLTVTKK